jgi:hypothetical protein
MPAIFTDALISAAPHEAIPPEQRIFEPFIGSWDLVVSWYRPDGAAERRLDGEWHFARVLEGRGIQDVWIVPPRAQRPATGGDYEYGTSLRFYDPTIEAWRSTWIGPQHRVVHSFVARRVGDQVQLETMLDGQRMRWRFLDITPGSFTWCNEREVEGRWLLTQDFKARRTGWAPLRP